MPLESAHNSFWHRPGSHLGIQTFRFCEHISYPLHAHPEYSMVFCAGGELQVQQLGISQRVKPGEVVVGNAQVPHASEYRCTDQDCEGVTIILSSEGLTEWLHEFEIGMGQPVLLGKIQVPELMPTVSRLMAETEDRGQGYRLVVDGLARQMGAEVFRRWPRETISLRPATPRLRQLPRHQLVKAIEYMHSCTKDEFRLQHLCEVVGSSESRFTQLFSASTRSNPLAFFNRLLIHRAQQQLATSDRPVKDVAYGLGFGSVSHFCTLFKSISGLSPQAYRHRGQAVVKSGVSSSGV